MEKSITLDYDDASSQGDENTSFLANNGDSMKETVRRKSVKYLLLANLFVFTMSALTLVCAIYMQHSKATYTTAGLMDEFDLFSPVARIAEYQRSQSKLPSPINSSAYVGVGAAADNAWKDIAYLPNFMISSKDFSKLHKAENSVKSTDPQTGAVGYQAGMGVFRQLQCLNLLRMATYSAYDKAGSMRENIDQCVEMLRMDLMCQSDISVFTFNEASDNKGVTPDYESNRVCRNFDTIKQWVNDNGVSSATG